MAAQQRLLIYLNRIDEAYRDWSWYYRCGYAHAFWDVVKATNLNMYRRHYS